MKTITLGQNVRVSDPCYDDDVWCKTRLTDVLPGKYSVDVTISDEGDWGDRCSEIIAIHEDYVGKELNWEYHSEIGVDSGQAGIFCESSYRNDSIEIETPNIDFTLPFIDNSGDNWYMKMCKFTLAQDRWGTYETGVVSSSGYGDGGYPLDVARDKSGHIIGMKITFIGEDEEDEDYDTCPECAGDMDWGDDICESCQNEKDYLEHIEAQEKDEES